MLSRNNYIDALTFSVESRLDIPDPILNCFKIFIPENFSKDDSIENYGLNEISVLTEFYLDEKDIQNA